MPEPRRVLALAALRRCLVVLAGLSAIGAAAACSDASATGGAPSGGGDASAPDATSDGSVEATGAEAMFRAFEGELVRTCGGAAGACHVNGSIGSAGKWLAPDAYASAKAWPGVLPADGFLEHSVILSQIEHTGPALVNQKELFPKVRAWVGAELTARGARLPTSQPFDVSAGFQRVELDAAAPGMEGAALTFEASMGALGLTLTQMRVVGATQKQLRIEAPFFNLLPANGPARSDKTNGFVGAMTVAPGETREFFTGALVLPQWTLGTKLQIVFQVLAVKDPPPMTKIGCKSLDAFKAQALPLLKQDSVNDEGTKRSCAHCHGSASSVAIAAMDLTKLDTDVEAACAQALLQVNLVDRAKSPLVVTPTGRPGGNPNHKTMDPAAVDAYVAGMRSWIDQE